MSYVAVLQLFKCSRTALAVSRALSTTSITRAQGQSKGTTGGKGGSAGPSVSTGVQVKNPDPPSNVFKKDTSKDLGPGASKQGDYKNPEYFQYHRMSYADMEVVMEKLRNPQPSSKGT